MGRQNTRKETIPFRWCHTQLPVLFGAKKNTLCGTVGGRGGGGWAPAVPTNELRLLNACISCADTPKSASLTCPSRDGAWPEKKDAAWEEQLHGGCRTRTCMCVHVGGWVGMNVCDCVCVGERTHAHLSNRPGRAPGKKKFFSEQNTNIVQFSDNGREPSITWKSAGLSESALHEP